jgi:hypothetical protein
MSDRFRPLACPVCTRLCGATDQRVGFMAVHCKDCREWRVIDLSVPAVRRDARDPFGARLRAVIDTAGSGVS